MNIARLLAHSPKQLRCRLGQIPSAVLSADKKQRYMLTRHTKGGNDLLVNFIMLNPSTADAEFDDQTILRCKGFAQSWGFEYMAVTNLWSYRTRYPTELFAAVPLSSKVDGRNFAAVELVARAADQTVVAYGNRGGHDRRDERILDLLNKADIRPYALRVTRRGFPHHPVHLPRATKPMVYRK